MADVAVYLGEKLKVRRHLIVPLGYLVGIKNVVKSGIQLNRIKLRTVIGQLIAGALGIEVFQVLSIPFGTSHVEIRLTGGSCPGKYRFSIGMVIRE